MIGFSLHRLWHAVFLLAGLATITFFIVHLAPGDPAILYVDPNTDPDAAVGIRKQLGLDEPLLLQYGKWLGVISPFEGILQGQWGISFSKHQPVMDVIAQAAPHTLLLAFWALALNYVVGIWLGIVLARKPGTVTDRSLTFISLFLYSMPAFWFSLMAILVFSLGLGWLPATQMRSLDAENLGLAESVFDVFRHMILPVCVLGLPAAASTARYTRHSVAEVLQKDYIRAARAKGLPERSILWRHVLRNAGIPLITLFGLTFPFLLGGSVIVETIFSWPGMGRVAIEAIYARDYPVLIASAMVGGVMVITGNFFADLLYAVMDPRVRVDRISMN